LPPVWEGKWINGMSRRRLSVQRWLHRHKMMLVGMDSAVVGGADRLPGSSLCMGHRVGDDHHHLSALPWLPRLRFQRNNASLESRFPALRRAPINTAALA